ncbi:methyl-CPG-binding domain protein [Klebsormidium nitens]|uniref:Methyl-CPG-binding domain protein n=1 Tax=Klebsormidium nitens TaxID=105231 RepID=A0A1Y1HM02_KLENI|nr:methyl-CPG-binding domain protein [Klebsormidium nitens]|eukprot:GAQ77646.1 methyl-CPG-binding domain protein [Klebsormidium nitens]
MEDSSQGAAPNNGASRLHEGEPPAALEDMSPTFKSPPAVCSKLLVQCYECRKWRAVPTAELYEEVREKLTPETPWRCEQARAWRADASCDMPPEWEPGGNLRWAYDKPGLPKTPQGWKRKVVLRGEKEDGSHKGFADVYYYTPENTCIRSLQQLERYLSEHPEQNLSVAAFSFARPSPTLTSGADKKMKQTAHAPKAATKRQSPTASSPYTQPLQPPLKQAHTATTDVASSAAPEATPSLVDTATEESTPASNAGG